MAESILFNLFETVYIDMLLPCEKENLHQCDEVIVILHLDSQAYELFKGVAIVALDKCNFLLNEALNNKLSLHSSLQQDIGYTANEYLQGNANLTYESFEGHQLWVGLKYLVWSSSCRESIRYSTWLYQKNNKIFLEVTPNYSTVLKQQKTYEEFMQDYQCLLIVEIPREIAKQWLSQTKELLNIIEENDE